MKQITNYTNQKDFDKKYSKIIKYYDEKLSNKFLNHSLNYVMILVVFFEIKWFFFFQILTI